MTWIKAMTGDDFPIKNKSWFPGFGRSEVVMKFTQNNGWKSHPIFYDWGLIPINSQ